MLVEDGQLNVLPIGVGSDGHVGCELAGLYKTRGGSVLGELIEGIGDHLKIQTCINDYLRPGTPTQGDHACGYICWAARVCDVLSATGSGGGQEVTLLRRLIGRGGYLTRFNGLPDEIQIKKY